MHIGHARHQRSCDTTFVEIDLIRSEEEEKFLKAS